MGLFSHEASLRAAERLINTLIDTCKRNGGSVYLVKKDSDADFVKLTSHIAINYFLPADAKED